MREHRWTILVLSAAVSACLDPTGIPREFTIVPPAASNISAWINGNVLTIELDVVNANLALPPDARIPVKVTGSSGDSEVVLSRSLVCRDDEYGDYVCGQVIIGTEARALETLAKQLRGHEAFLLSQLGGGTAVVAYFPFGSFRDIRATVRRWPGVRWVEPNAFVSVAASSIEGGVMPPEIRGFMLLDEAPVVVGNAFIEAARGEHIQLEYTASPDGLLASEIVWE